MDFRKQFIKWLHGEEFESVRSQITADMQEAHKLNEESAAEIRKITAKLSEAAKLAEGYQATALELYDTQMMLSGIMSAVQDNTNPAEYSKIMQGYVDIVGRMRKSQAEGVVSPKNAVHALEIEAATFDSRKCDDVRISKTKELTDVFDELFMTPPQKDEDEIVAGHPVDLRKRTHNERLLAAMAVDATIVKSEFNGGSLTEVWSDETVIERSFYDDGSVAKEAVTYPNGYREVENYVQGSVTLKQALESEE